MNTEPTYVIAALEPKPSLYSYANDRERAEQMLAAANDYAGRHGEAARYSIITDTAFNAAVRSYYLSQPATEITKERYWEMLEILPPVAWEHRDGVERFLMSEFTEGPFTTQFAQRNGRYFEKTVDAYDRKTWMTGAEVDAIPAGFAAREEERRENATAKGVA